MLRVVKIVYGEREILESGLTKESAEWLQWLEAQRARSNGNHETEIVIEEDE